MALPQVAPGSTNPGAFFVKVNCSTSFQPEKIDLTAVFFLKTGVGISVPLVKITKEYFSN